MKIYLGTDHRGFKLTQEIISWLKEKQLDFEYVGNNSYDPLDDYVDYALLVAKNIIQEIKNEKSAFGIVLCGSGVGVDIASNRIKGIRCGLGFKKEQIKAARADDDINILTIPADYCDLETTKEIIEAFLETPFKNQEKYKRRIEKIENL